MWTRSFLAAVLVLQTALAHYTFSDLLVNGTWSKEWQYIRKVSPEFHQTTFAPGSDVEDSIFNPQQGDDLYSSNITCGRLAHLSAGKTETATVLAGSKVGFRTWFTGSYDYEIYHSGVAQIYLTKIPDGMKIEEVHGEEFGWFKIASIAQMNDTDWITYYAREVNFTMPLTTPPGEYLMRIEHLRPGNGPDIAQFYVNCAHVNIVGLGGGKPTGFAKFPGTYEAADPGIWVPKNIKSEWPAWGLNKYVAPGPKVWSG